MQLLLGSIYRDNESNVYLDNGTKLEFKRALQDHVMSGCNDEQVASAGRDVAHTTLNFRQLHTERLTDRLTHTDKNT